MDRWIFCRYFADMVSWTSKGLLTAFPLGSEPFHLVARYILVGFKANENGLFPHNQKCVRPGTKIHRILITGQKSGTLVLSLLTHSLNVNSNGPVSHTSQKIPLSKVICTGYFNNTEANWTQILAQCSLYHHPLSCCEIWECCLQQYVWSCPLSSLEGTPITLSYILSVLMYLLLTSRTRKLSGGQIESPVALPLRVDSYCSSGSDGE